MKRIKKILASLMVTVMVLTAAPISGFVGLELPDFSSIFSTKAEAATYSGTCGRNLTWLLDTETGELVISGMGAMYIYSSSSDVPWYSYRSSIKKVTIGDGVTSIGYNEFAYCDSLTSVTIPDSVTTIGYAAFYDCDSLTDVYYNGDLKGWLEIRFENEYSNPMYYGEILYVGGKLLEGDVVIPDGITCIDYGRFRNCNAITSVTIPDSVTSIGNYAFSDCTSLTSITVDKDNTAYSSDEYGVLFNKDKTQLIQYPIGNERTSCTIPDSVTSIGSHAFRGCTSLTSVTIPDSVTSIGDGAFEGLVFELKKDSYAETYAKNNGIPYTYIYDGSEEKTVSVTVTSKLSFEIDKETYIMTINCVGNMLSFVNEDAPWVPYKLYIKHIIINNGCTSISENAFKNFGGLRSITIPDSVTSIGNYAFYYCTSLTSVTIPDSVTSIGEDAFAYCHSLTSVTIPDSVTTIGDSAFAYCHSLTSVTIGGSVTTIGSYAFYDCTSLTSVTIPDSVTTIGNSAFSSCDSLTSVTIPDSVTTIGGGTFFSCDSLTSVTIPDSVTSIGSNAFYNCSGITELTLPVSASINSYSFSGCNNINKITLTKGKGTFKDYSSSSYQYTPWYQSGCPTVIIEDGVTGIGSYMFYGCAGLEDITLPFSVESIANNAFSGCQKLEKLTVNNPNCTFGTECTSYYTTICGYAGSTAETYANEMGFDFELIIPCEHNNYHIEQKDSTCIETGYEKLICDDCGSTFSYTESPKVDHDYKTITAPPTCVDEGVVVCLCKVCRDAYISEILDPLGHSELVWVTVKVPSTRNEGIMNQVCPACGEVFDTKTVPAISLSADSTANIDFETNTISGFESGSSSIGDYLSATNNGYTFTCESEKIVTGTVITLTAGEDMINEFEAVIFGDVNGDSWYDGQDAIIVDCLANGMLTKDDVSEAVYMAADCNHDGVIDQLDVDLLNQAGAFLANVDQSKSYDELAMDEAYIEYLDLIDQTPEIDAEDETDTPETDAETEDTTPEQDAKVDIFEMILNFIKSIFKMLLSYIPMPLK